MLQCYVDDGATEGRSLAALGRRGVLLKKSIFRIQFILFLTSEGINNIMALCSLLEIIMPSHYDTLKVKQNASIDDIRKSYIKLSREYHPDRVRRRLNFPFSPEEVQRKITDATQKIQNINQAYETLSDPELRREYDDNQDASQLDIDLSNVDQEFIFPIKYREQDELLKACCDGNLAKVTALLDVPYINPNGIKGLDGNSFDDTNQVRNIPLQEAVIRKHVALVIALLAHPKIRAETVERHNVRWKNNDAWHTRWHTPDTRTPLKIAAKQHNVEIVNLILRHYIMQMTSENCSIKRLTKPPRHRKLTLLNELAKYRSELWAQLKMVGREQRAEWYLEILTEILDSEGKLPNQQHPLYLVFTTNSPKLSFFTLPDVISQMKTELLALQQPRPS